MGNVVLPRESGWRSLGGKDQHLECWGGKPQGFECFWAKSASRFGDQEMDFVLETALDLKDLHAVFGFKCGIAVFFELGTQAVALCKGKRGKAEHDVPHDLRAWNSGMVARSAVLKERKIQADFRADIFLGTQIHPTAELAQGAVHKGEAHSAALGAWMVCGHGFDGDLLEVLRDTATFVLDGDADIRPCGNAISCFWRGDLGVFGAESDRAALGEGFFGIVKEGHKHLFDAGGRQQDKEGLFAWEEAQGMFWAKMLLPAREVLSQESVKINLDGRAALAVAAKALEMMSEIKTALCSAFNHICIVCMRCFFEVFFEYLRVIEDDHEQVVEVVGEPPRKADLGLDAFILEQILLSGWIEMFARNHEALLCIKGCLPKWS